MLPKVQSFLGKGEKMSQMLPYLVKEVYQYQVTKTHAGSTASDRIVHISQCIAPQQRGCWLFQMLLITLLWSEQVGTSRLSIVLKSADLCLLNLCLSVQLHCQIQEKRREHLLLQLTVRIRRHLANCTDISWTWRPNLPLLFQG